MPFSSETTARMAAVALALSVISSGIAACGGEDDDGGATEANAAQDEAPNYLFVERSEGGRFQPTGKDTGVLTMNGLDPTLLAFTDRPARNTRHIPLAEFIATWDERFADSPPNAAVVLDNEREGRDMVAVTLEHPRLIGPDSAAVQFKATLIDDDSADEIAARYARTADSRLSESFGPASLFIDSSAGVRSLEVQAVNNTRGELTVARAELSGSASKWIVGEQPRTGSRLQQHTVTVWGVSTDDKAAEIGATIALSGQGSSPITIQLSISRSGSSNVATTDNDKVQARVIKVSADPSHPQFQLELVPTPPP